MDGLPCFSFPFLLFVLLLRVGLDTVLSSSSIPVLFFPLSCLNLGCDLHVNY